MYRWMVELMGIVMAIGMAMCQHFSYVFFSTEAINSKGTAGSTLPLTPVTEALDPLLGK